MRKLFPIALIAMVHFAASGIRTKAQQQGKDPLRLIQTILMPNVKGRIDHMDVDVKGKRLFVAGLENGTVEVIDLKDGKWSIDIEMTGFANVSQDVVIEPNVTYQVQAMCVHRQI